MYTVENIALSIVATVAPYALIPCAVWALLKLFPKLPRLFFD